jgi:hypothetical protein
VRLSPHIAETLRQKKKQCKQELGPPLLQGGVQAIKEVEWEDLHKAFVSNTTYIYIILK